jgi:hypothetical protein
MSNHPVSYTYPDGNFVPLPMPGFAVGFAVAHEDAEQTYFVVRMKTVSDQTPRSAYNEAVKQYGSFKWTPTDGINVGHIKSGAPNPYWWVRVDRKGRKVTLQVAANDPYLDTFRSAASDQATVMVDGDPDLSAAIKAIEKRVADLAKAELSLRKS